MRFILLIILFCSLGLAGCATKQQSAIGNVIHAVGIMGTGVPVYVGDITRKYRVIKEIRIRRRQIPGPNYYDDLSGAQWMASAGFKAGADAVIHFGARRIEGQVLFFDPGHFEAWGTAVKFTTKPTKN